MKDRNQNPVVGDEVLLRMFTRNSNNPADIFSIESVEIYKVECPPPDCCTTGELLIEKLTDCATRFDVGGYQIGILADPIKYGIGKYHDVWNVIFREGDPVTQVVQDFQLYPDLWITSPTPVVYSFDFSFTPNRVRQGSIKWLIIQIHPNVPRATDLVRYYENVAISAEIKISIEQNCGPCAPAERDLRLITDCELVTTRDKVFAYYKFDTTDLDCGIYDVWFQIEYAGNIDISPRQQIQVY